MKTKKSILRTGIAASLLSLAAGYVALEGTAGAKTSMASLVPSWLWTVAFTPPHPPLPQIVNSGGGIVAAPRVVPILYASDPNAAALKDFAAKLGTSSYLASRAAEYGVTSFTVLPPIVIDEPAPASIGSPDVEAWLATKLKDPSFPANDGNTIYAFMYPKTTAVSFANWTGALVPICGGWHLQGTTADGTVLPYTLTGLCPDLGGATDLDFATRWTASALLGAATNPGANSGAYGWADTDFAGSGWQYFGGGEIGTMCSLLDDSTVRPADLGYVVPRVYSNTAAAHDHDPCPAGPTSSRYFGAAPVVDGSSLLVKSISVPAGGEAVVPLVLFGDGPGCGWDLSAKELATFEPTPSLTFEFDEAHGRAGEVRYVKIKRAASTTPAGPLPLAIVSTAGGVSHEWLVVAAP
jgi:hypothetical protein